MSKSTTPSQLIAALMDCGMDQPEIADLVPTSQATINRIYHGKIKKPSFVIIDRLREMVEEKKKTKRKKRAA